jgi:hypothetical protein
VMRMVSSQTERDLPRSCSRICWISGVGPAIFVVAGLSLYARVCMCVVCLGGLEQGQSWLKLVVLLGASLSRFLQVRVT